ncbi:2'-5' RNA ligase [Salsuginibacillus halophilus]|uniref:RNA 2',3'-cyclic phosphodiesterase n=1 Tax=Salsuginibacillus halophilus TaxID=517424 RepID=A0A2P8HE81_9BACI|nr:RNA 2',3'-cyclic phosphodiesterase [Salsuginibacillus halophilus]PSL44523.1 2'-5' RNA ligase [Salsuginibacillus halophilus]
MVEQSHYFVAVQPPLQVREQLKKDAEALRPHAPFKHWVHVNDYHITLKFLGSIRGVMNEDGLIDVLKEAAQATVPFQVRLQGIHTFGPAHAPRVLWYSVQADEALSQLQQFVDDILSKRGFTKEKRSFTPHVTLAKKNNDQPVAYKLSLAERKAEDLHFSVDQFSLFKVHPKKAPMYEQVEAFQLHGGYDS